MAPAEALVEPEANSDPAYPTHSPADPLYPGQTLEPLCAPLEGIATPAMWSRLGGALEGALGELWQRVGLLGRARPSCWVTLHYGRIAVNAHGWERMRTLLAGEAPDPALVEPPASGLPALLERWEAWRVRLRGRRFPARLQRAEQLGERRLSRAAARNPTELDSAELARGPLDERTWRELLLPWLGRRLGAAPYSAPDASLRAAIALEQRFAAELGRRLVARRLLQDPVDVVYLSVEERIQAVHESSDYWAKLVESRRVRIASFVEIEVPLQFWGRPRVGAHRNG